jgi:hypothetical protein
MGNQFFAISFNTLENLPLLYYARVFKMKKQLGNYHKIFCKERSVVLEYGLLRSLRKTVNNTVLEG